MASKRPIIRQVSLNAVVLQIFIIWAMMGLARLAGFNDPFVPIVIVYLCLFIGLRKMIPRNHRRGVAFLRVKEFEKAAQEFEASYRFFERHPWLDRFRYLTLLSASRISYREMALLNSAYCYGLIGDGRKMKEYYEKALQRFPESEIAKLSLQMIESARNSA